MAANFLGRKEETEKDTRRSNIVATLNASRYCEKELEGGEIAGHRARGVRRAAGQVLIVPTAPLENERAGKRNGKSLGVRSRLVAWRVA